MSEQEVPAVRTTLGVVEFIAALQVVLPDALQRTFAIFWSQYRCETGGKHCYGFNYSNIKHVAGDGFNWHALKGVWEGVSAAEAVRLVATGQAVYDVNGAHQRAVAPRTCVVFNTNHPASRFRAYDSAERGMREWVAKLQKRFSRAWPPALAGNVVAFANGLKSHGYMTASAGAYASAMAGPFADAMGIRLNAQLEPIDPNKFSFMPIHGTHIVD